MKLALVSFLTGIVAILLAIAIDVLLQEARRNGLSLGLSFLVKWIKWWQRRGRLPKVKTAQYAFEKGKLGFRTLQRLMFCPLQSVKLQRCCFFNPATHPRILRYTDRRKLKCIQNKKRTIRIGEQSPTAL